MSTKIERRAVGATAAAALWIALAASSAPAQDGGAPVPPPPDSSVAPSAPSEPAAPPPAATSAPAPTIATADSSGLTLPVLADVRARDAVSAELAGLDAQRSVAADRMVRAREAEIRWRSRVELAKSSIAAIRKRQDLLKKEKRDAEAKDLDAERRREETKRVYFERVRDMYGAEGDYRKATVECLDARRLTLQAELKLSERWAGGGAIDRSSETVAAELRAIELARDQAGKVSSMSDKERTWADRRKSAAEAWKKL